MAKRKLPNWIAAYKEYTDNTESPDSFHIWTALWTLAGAVQRKAWLQLGQLTAYTNIYVCLVAPPGKARKTSAINIGTKLLNTLELPMVATSTTREALISRAVESAQTTEIDTGKFLLHNSLSLASDEFAVFLGKDNFPMISMLTDWYDCKSNWVYETKKDGTQTVDGVWFNMISAATPQSLRMCLPDVAFGGGLTSRMIFVVEDDKRKSVPLPFQTPREEQLEKDLAHDLKYIHDHFVGAFTIDEAARRYYTDWYNSEERHKGLVDHRLAGYLDRKPKHVLKVAMLMHMATKDNFVLDEQDMKAAVILLDMIEPKMPDAFTEMGSNQLAPIQSRVLEYVASFSKVTFKQVHRVFWRDATEEQLQQIMSALVSTGYVKHLIGGADDIYQVKRKKKKEEQASDGTSEGAE